MNTERLHALARELHTEITSMELVNLVTQLHDYLQGAINSPDEHTQRQVETTLNSLIASLEEAPSNQLSPGMRANLADLFLSEDCSADRLVGKGLSSELRRIFEAGSYTSVQTLDQLKQLLDRLNTFASAIDQVLTSFRALQVEDESLDPGTSVVGMVMPAGSFDGSLRELQRELEFFGQLLVELTEVAEGGASEHEVYSLYASDLGIDVIATLAVAADFAGIVTALQYAFDKIAQFRDLKAKAEDLGVDAQTVEGLSAQGHQVMDDALDEIHAKVFQNCKVDDEGRVRELETAFELRLNGLANRLDKGFMFEVRTELLEEPTEPQESQAEQVAALSTVEFRQIEGPRMLELPETDEEAEQNSSRKKKERSKSKTKAKSDRTTGSKDPR